MLLSMAGPVGPEFASTTSVHPRYAPVMAANNGGSVLVWGDSGAQGIYAQRFDASGAAQGPELRISNAAPSYDSEPSVAIDADGDFVVVWQRSRLTDYDIYARRYNAAGVAQSGEFRVNTYTSDSQRNPAVAMDDAGAFAIIWGGAGAQGQGVYLRQYTSAGVARADEVSVVQEISTVQNRNPIAMDADGDFVVAWRVFDSGAMRYRIYAQRYNPAGQAQGSPIPANTTGAAYDAIPVAAMDADGDFVLAWEASRWGGGAHIRARHFNEEGIAQGDEISVNSYWEENGRPSIDMDADGDFIIAWHGAGRYSTIYDIAARRYDANGVAQSPQFTVNTDTTKDQRHAALAMTSGGFFVAWQNGDTAGMDVRGQRFGVSDQPAAVSGRVWNDANNNGLEDEGEAGLDSVVVRLWNTSGALVAETVTSGGGLYQFDSVLPGEPMYVQFRPLPGYFVAARDIGTDDAVDSDIDPDSGQSASYTLLPDQRLTDVDAGMMPAATVRGSVFSDVNVNVLFDASELALDGRIVFADINGNGVLDSGEPMTTSDSTGKYTLGSIRPGPALVRLLPVPHWSSPPAREIELMPDQTVGNVDFSSMPDTTFRPFGPAGAEFRANWTTQGDQQAPDVAIQDDGSFVIVWSS